jgi:excisionase family DNA binding protein
VLKPTGDSANTMSTTNDTNQAAPGMAAQIEPELLTKAEAAHLLGVSIRTIDNMMRQRRISFVKLTAKMVRFPRREILQHVREHLTVHALGSEGT